MVTLTQNKTLGPGDLFICIRDGGGNLVTPATLTYSVFTNQPGSAQTALVSAATPASSSIGIYYVNITVPTAWYGPIQLVWNLQQYSTSDPVSTIIEDIFVEYIAPADNSTDAPSVLIAPQPCMDVVRANYVMKVREILSDKNPNRDYHFRPPTPAKTIAGFSTRVGFIWTDETILRMLELSISILNYWNPKSKYGFTITSCPRDWGNVAAIKAAALCLSAEAARWAEEGGWSYSLNGVSTSIDKFAYYSQLSSNLNTEFEAIAPLLTANRPVSAGLRQFKFLV